SDATSWSVLDDRLAFAGTLVEQPFVLVPDALPLDARTTLALYTELMGTELRLGDDVLFHDVVGNDIAYEPTTKLAAVALAHGVGFVHVDTRRTSALTTSSDDVVDHVYLLDPALARGKVALLEHGGWLYALSAGELAGGLDHGHWPHEPAATVVAVD